MTRKILFLALIAAFSPAQGQQIGNRPIPKLTGAIAIDGDMADAAWATALEVPMPYEIEPGDNSTPPVETIARIAYDEDALYIAFHAKDPEPGKIRALLRDRDSAYRDDFVGIIVDTFDDQRRAYEFFVNPLGVQMDLIQDETAGGNEDDSWDGLWSSAGRVAADGYVVEMRIPFSTLRFRDGSGAQRWSMNFFRSYPRNVRHQISASKMSRDSNCFLCSFDKYEGMAGVRQGRNLEIVPTITVTRPEWRDAQGTAWQNDGVEIEPGVDIAWAPSPKLTLNATVNPDFSQVESDQAQLNLNDSFALFYPEKRPFFLEGADYFNTQFQVLYTRQVNDPDAGMRITGRTDDGAYGAFVARDNTIALLVPGELRSSYVSFEQKTDVAVGRYRHNIDEHTTLGVIGTYRSGDDYSNGVFGIDGRWQKDPHTFTAQFLRSESEYPLSLGLGYDEVSGNAWRTYYGYSDREWSFNAGHTHIDPGFRADLGFMGQVGYRKSVIGGGHTWYGDEGAKITRINFYSDWDITHRYDGQLLERELEASVSMQGPLQSNLNVHALTRVRFWQRSTDPVGALFDEHFADISGNATVFPGVRLGGRIEYGQRLDQLAARTGRLLSASTWGEIDLGRAANLSHEVSWQRMRRDGGTAYIASVFDTRLSWQLDPRQRLRLSLQGSHVARDADLYDWTSPPPYRTLSNDWAAQLLYSYKVNPRTAFYAGFSYGAYRDDDATDMFGYTRNLFFKYSYGWQPTF